MNKEYSIQQTTYHNLKKGDYTPISIKIFDDEGKRGKFPWERIWIDRPLNRGTKIYIVTFKSARESDARAFLTEDVARKFLRSLSVVIELQQGKNVLRYLDAIPINNSVDFKTDMDNFTVTLAEAKI